MKHTRLIKKGTAFFIAIFMAFAMIGCEGTVPSDEKLLSNMKEFTTPSGTASIYLNQDWTAQDAGLNSALLAGNKADTEAFVMLQAPKSAFPNLDSMDSMIEFTEDAYGLSDFADAQAPKVPNLINVKSHTCTISDEYKQAEALLVFGESDYAYYMFIQFSSHLTKRDKASFAVSCSTFAETVPEVENNSTVVSSDTLQWINGTYAILTAGNQMDYTLFGGAPLNAETQEFAISVLNDSWGVTDRNSADENLEWLLTEGHAADFKNTMEQLDQRLKEIPVEQRVDYLTLKYDMTEIEAQQFANSYVIYEKYGPSAIDAWDDSRTMSQLGFFYLAGYYTETEALDQAFEIAQDIQTTYTSWDEFIDSYLRGYEYWSGESSADRREIYEDLKAKEDSPFKLDWNLPLRKNW